VNPEIKMATKAEEPIMEEVGAVKGVEVARTEIGNVDIIDEAVGLEVDDDEPVRTTEMNAGDIGVAIAEEDTTMKDEAVIGLAVREETMKDGDEPCNHWGINESLYYSWCSF